MGRARAWAASQGVIWECRRRVTAAVGVLALAAIAGAAVTAPRRRHGGDRAARRGRAGAAARQGRLEWAPTRRSRPARSPT
jgi:hypothetical protein